MSTNMRSILRRIRTVCRAALGTDVLLSRDVTVETQTFGSGYGAWDVATDLVHSGSIVYAFGVGEDITFDLALVERFGLTVHAFDPTPKSIDWLRRQALPEQFILHPYGIAARDGDVTFHPPENPAHVSHSMLDTSGGSANSITVPVRRLGTIMSELGHDRVDLLKMDIEGAEYEVIEDLCVSGIRPRQLLVEFHHRFPGMGPSKTRASVETLRAMGYRLFSVSDRNEEFGFVLVDA